MPRAESDRWTLLIHGGAGGITRDTLSPEADRAARAGLQAALAAGAAVLAADGMALDAVEAAVRVLEDDPAFNAGRGAALTRDGTVELDAAIMDGAARRAGAVAGVTATRHPVSLARAVMDRTPHVLLAGVGADLFAREAGVEQAAPDWFVTPMRQAQRDRLLAGGGDGFDAGMTFGTVGAVARDADGHLAAATSTGGVTGKRMGRVGDSPVPGAGTWADDRACAVSTTGSGEHFLRVGVGHEIAARLRLAGQGLEKAVATGLAEVAALGGTGGVIAVASRDAGLWSFTTPGMYRGRVSADRLATVAIYDDEAIDLV